MPDRTIITLATLVLTIAGTEEDWASKVVNINITLLTPTNDYDLYVHKGENCLTTPRLHSGQMARAALFG